MRKLTETDLRGFAYFLAVAEEKTLAAAARRLHMAQPPLSVQIRKLEDRVGVPLFERSSAGMQLNEAGRALYARAHDAMRLAQDGFEVAYAIGQGQRGLLHVGIAHVLCYELLPRLTQLLEREMPHVEVRFEELDTAGIRAALKERRISAALCVPAFAQAGVRTLACGSLALRAALPRQLLGAQEGPIGLAQLADYPLIALPAGSDGESVVLRMFRDAGLVPRTVHRVQTVHGALSLVRALQGVCVLPEIVRAMLPPQVALVPIADAQSALELVAAWSEDAPDAPLAQRFVEAVGPLLRAVAA